MHGMLRRCQDIGLKLNPEKCFVKQEKIRFYGVVCSQDGIQPDPNKISALKQMSAPTSRQELQTFLGLANYMGPFIPNLSTLTAPLRELLKESHQFDWSPAHQEAYNKIKDSISSEVTLTYFDPKKEITLQVDASLKGLCAVLWITNLLLLRAKPSLMWKQDMQTLNENCLLWCTGVRSFILTCLVTISQSTLITSPSRVFT